MRQSIIHIPDFALLVFGETSIWICYHDCIVLVAHWFGRPCLGFGGLWQNLSTWPANRASFAPIGTGRAMRAWQTRWPFCHGRCQQSQDL